MWTLFSISLGMNKPEFSVRGIAVYTSNSATIVSGSTYGMASKYQGLANGAVFVEGPDYETVRAVVMDVVELNKVDISGLQ